MIKMRDYCKNIFPVFLTLLLSPIFYLGIFFNKIKSQKERLKILVIQRGKIGDLVCTTGIFKLIKEKYPNCYLTVLATIYNSDIIANNPYIDEIIKFDEGRSNIGYLINIARKLKKGKFCFSISLQPDGINSILPFWSIIPCRISISSHQDPTSSKILSIFNSHNMEFRDNDMTFEHFAKILEFFDINVSRLEIDLFIDETSERKAGNFLKEKGLSENEFLVGICPTVGSNKLKEWGTEKWITLSNMLIDNLGAKIILIGSPKDPIISKIQQGTMMRAVDSSGYFVIGEFAALLRKMKLCVSPINAPMHIADGVGVPIVAIAGPVNFHNQPPIGKRTKIVHHSISCYPCATFTKTVRFCKEGHHRCMEETTVDEIYRAITDLMGKK